MKNLNLRNSIFVFFLFGCSSFKIVNETDGLTELLVTPDRVLVQCLELDEDPDVGAYGFMFHVLDEENTVTTAIIPIRPDKENCDLIVRKINRVLKNSRKVYVSYRFSISKHKRTKEHQHFRYTFPSHGTFSDNGRSLEFVYIQNERGECYGPMSHDNEPCPDFPFPIEKYFKNKILK